MYMAVYEKSFIIVLGAIAGILPDFLDFKIIKFFWPIDDEIIPDWPIPDSEKIAKEIAAIIDNVWENKKPYTIQIHTIKTGPNTWRRWYIHLDPDNKKVKVGIGPIQTFGGRPFEATMEEIPKEKRVAEASFNAPLIYNYKDRTIKMKILSGPTVSFVPKENGVEVVFLPWHRYISHSFVVGGIFSIFVMLIMLALGSTFYRAYIYGLAFFVGYSSHILTDQPGHMGSNLFWPFTKKRIEGLKITESADPFANLGTFWTAIAILLWQMNSVIEPQPITFPWTYNILGAQISLFYILVFISIPWLIIIVLRQILWKPTGDPYLRDLFLEEVAELAG